MKYNPLVPQYANNSLAETQPELKTNFKTLGAAFAIDHIGLTAPTTAGNHRVIELLDLKGTPQSNLSKITLFSRNVKEVEDSKEDVNQVFIRYQGNGVTFQYICYQVYQLNETPERRSYFTFLPGRIIVYFGDFTSLPGETLKNTLRLSPPIATRIIGVNLCPTGPTPTFIPKFTIPEEVDGFFTTIKLKKGQNLGTQTPPPPCNYLVIGNF